ncbi:IS110 family transposase [candidate division KSB1 bacterium]|nr:IS110 family transposase [candidate division KSB1 bacterium]
MVPQINQIDFKGQRFFAGIDVHDKNWVVTIRSCDLELRTLSINPKPEDLAHFLRHHYPGGSYHSVYEAGFCGFWIHRRLTQLGINNIITHAADIPTTQKEKQHKRDQIDSRKLARELANGSLKGIWVPDTFHESLRSLSRLRYKQMCHQTLLKNRIKSHLHYYGIPIPNRAEVFPWSGNFIAWLKKLNFTHEPAKEYLLLCLEELIYTKQHIAKTLHRLREHSNQPETKEIVHDFLMSVPGIGFITAITLYSELVDPKRFPRLDHMACYVGLIPSVIGSGDKEKILGITERHNTYLRYLLIEAVWTAVRKDPALTLAFAELLKRMSKQEAIVRIAKKLLNRIRSVWINKRPYVNAVC